MVWSVRTIFDMGTYMADFRMLDPALARWWQIDPKTENQYSSSPYLAIHNNPVRFNDPKGDIAPAIWAAIVYAVENAGETAIDVALGVYTHLFNRHSLLGMGTLLLITFPT